MSTCSVSGVAGGMPVKTSAHSSLSVPAIFLIILATSAPAVGGVTLNGVGQSWQTYIKVIRPAGLVIEDWEDFENSTMPLIDKKIHLYSGYGPAYGDALAEQQITTYIGPSAIGETAPELVLSGKANGGSTAGYGYTALSYRFTLDQSHPYTLTGPASYQHFFLEGPGLFVGGGTVGGGSSGILAPGAYLLHAATLGLPTTYSLVISAVPEPSMMSGTGIALLALRRRRYG